MSLTEKLSRDYKTALKAGHRTKVGVLRMVMAAIKNREIEKRTPLTDEEVKGVLGSFVKRGNESIEQFSRVSREDLVQKEKEEIAVIQCYLPRQLSSDEIEHLVAETIQETGATGQADFGKVMKAIMVKARGQVDGKLVNDIVRKSLET